LSSEIVVFQTNRQNYASAYGDSPEIVVFCATSVN